MDLCVIEKKKQIDAIRWKMSNQEWWFQKSYDINEYQIQVAIYSMMNALKNRHHVELQKNIICKDVK